MGRWGSELCHADPVHWGVPNRVWVLELLAALPFVAVGAFTKDPPTLAFAGAAALLLTVLAIRDRVAQVRLSASADGLTVVHGFAGRRTVPWSKINAVRVEQAARRGRSTPMLEIDAGDSVYLLSGRELGAEPGDVLAALDVIRP